MSENTQDDFEAASPVHSDEEAQPAASTVPLANEPGTDEQSPSTENTLPPEAQGEANGGPLGCCLGVMVGMLLSLSLAVLSRAFAGPLVTVFGGNYGLLGLIVRILMGILVFVLALLFGIIGWKLGRRFYREYEPPTVKGRKELSGRSRTKKRALKA